MILSLLLSSVPKMLQSLLCDDIFLRPSVAHTIKCQATVSSVESVILKPKSDVITMQMTDSCI